jgi:hypothetical protein
MELVRDAPLLFSKSSEPEDKRRILDILFQNPELHGERLLLKYKKPFNLMASCNEMNSWLGWRGGGRPAPYFRLLAKRAS